MTRLVWNQAGEKFYETGVDRGVLYPSTRPGVAWAGLISVDEGVSGGGVEAYHFDGIKYLDVVSSEDFEATIDAFSAPPEFYECDGSWSLAPGLFATHQRRSTFGLAYRTRIGNDIDGTEHGYKLHLVYNATAAPASRSNKSINDSPDPESRQWTMHTVPSPASTYKPTAHIIINSKLVASSKLTSLENLLYGTTSANPSLPTQAAIIALLA